MFTPAKSHDEKESD